MARRESDDLATERTPLLPSSTAHTAPEARSNVTASGAFHTPLDDAASGKSIDIEAPSKKRRPRAHAALLLLCIALVGIPMMAFLGLGVAERYAREAVMVNVTSVSVESFTPRGVQARVKASVHVDASRVGNRFIRNFGRFGTTIVKKISTEKGQLHVFLVDYGRSLLGNASVPPMVIDVRNGHSNDYDFVSDVEPVSLESAQEVVKDYLDGNLDSLRVMGTTRLKLRLGILPLGKKWFKETMKFEALPSLPHYNVTKLEIFEKDGIVVVNASATIPNPYPVTLNLPSLGFEISLPGCNKKMVSLASATTPKLMIQPKTDINITLSGTMHNLPDALTSECPGTNRSPMDKFLQSYLHGNSSIVYVNGDGHHKDSDAPKWLSTFLKAITVPAPFPGHKFDNMVENIGLSHVKFKLPDRDARPGTPEAAPKISAVIDAVVALPKEMKFPIDVHSIKASANLSYHGEKFGEMHMTEWAPASSRPTDDGRLAVVAEILQAPLDITDYVLFRKVVERLVWGGGRGLELGIDGLADVRMETTLGTFAVRGIPTKGDVLIKALPNVPDFAPKATSMDILSTTDTSMTLQIGLLVENPTEYSAEIPYMSVLLEKDGFILGNASISRTSLHPGSNSIIVTATYGPSGEGKNATNHAIKAGLALLGEYASGKNTTLTIRPHRGSLPGLPELSKALSALSVTLPVPQLLAPTPPDDPDDPTQPPPPPSPQPFLAGATMHVFSSTATFLLHNPFPRTPIRIYDLKGEAVYNGTKLGTVAYGKPWDVLAGSEAGDGGLSPSPRLPVEWRLGGAAYRAMMDALGGELRINATAEVLVGVGNWKGKVRFDGEGLKAGITW